MIEWRSKVRSRRNLDLRARSLLWLATLLAWGLLRSALSANDATGFTTAPQAQSVGRTDARAILLERDRRRATSEEYVGEVVVIAKDGRERRKTWHSYRSGAPRQSSRLIRFLSPPDVRGVGYLLQPRPEATPDEWLYLPSMKRERRIGARDREGAFVNTDFSYDDLSLLEFDERLYDATLLAPQTIDGVRALRIKLTPKSPSMYSSKTLILRDDSLDLLGIEYFIAGQASPVKTLAALDYHVVDGYNVAGRLEMKDLRRGSRTIVYLRDLVLGRTQPQDRFTLQNLRREDVEPAAPRPPSAGPSVRPSARPSPFVQNDDVGEPDSRSGWARGTTTGYVDGRSFGLFGSRATRSSTLWGTLFVRHATRIGRARVSAAVRFEGATSDQVGTLAFDPADRRPARSPISVRELAIVVPLSPGVDLEAGRLDMNWGVTDGYSPASAFLPRDLSDPLTEERLPLWSVRIRGERRGIGIEVLAVPVTTPWRLPNLTGQSSSFAGTDIAITEQPWSVPRRGFGLFRVSGTSHDWDLSTWARTGTRPAPVLVTNFPVEGGGGTNSVPSSVTVSRHFASEHAAGFSASHAAGGWTVVGELNASHSSDPDVGSAAIIALGASRIVRNGSFTATVAANAIEPPTTPLLMFDRALLPCAIIAAHETESWGDWSAVWLATFRTVGGVLGVEVGRNMTDVVKLTIGADLPHGATLSPAVAFSGGERVRAGVRWSW